MQSCMAPSVKCWTSARGFECTAVGANTFSLSLTFSAGTFCLTSVCTWSILMCLCDSDETLTRPLCSWCCIKVQSEDKCCWCKCTSLAVLCSCWWCVAIAVVVMMSQWWWCHDDRISVLLITAWAAQIWTVRTHAGDLNLIQRRGVFLITTLLLILHAEAEITIHLLIRICCVCVWAVFVRLLKWGHFGNAVVWGVKVSHTNVCVSVGGYNISKYCVSISR